MVPPLIPRSMHTLKNAGASTRSGLCRPSSPVPGVFAGCSFLAGLPPAPSAHGRSHAEPQHLTARFQQPCKVRIDAFAEEEEVLAERYGA